MATALRVFLAAVSAGAVQAGPAPHLVFILADDLGWHDTSVFGDQSPETRAATHNMTALADEGVRLSHHYVHWHCSPTRRTFLSGRTPLHHGEALSDTATDDLDLRWRWVSEVLADEGYVGHWYGKGHTGFMSMEHLPANRGFDGGSVLFLGGSGSYYNMPRMNGTAPLFTEATDPHTYSTDLFGSLAVAAVEAHDAARPMFMYLPWQAVHGPYDLPPHACSLGGGGGNGFVDPQIRAMIADVDRWVGALVAALKKKEMYDNTLIVWTSDNGGMWKPKTGGGNNFPLRGEKHTNWQGGMRTQTFVSGGVVPAGLRGTTNDGTYHVSDWYPTFCKLAGGKRCDDAAPVPPLPVDPTDPSKDIYGKHSWPSVDGRDIWGALTAGAASAPAYQWLSSESAIKDGRWKIVLAQPDPSLEAAFPPVAGWRKADGEWIEGPGLDTAGCGLAFQNRTRFAPCLFDLHADPREKHDLSAARPDLVADLWGRLNATRLTRFAARSPAALLGPCNEACARKHWRRAYQGEFEGPICGVPGCV
eukprot:TRINITY_DN3371_c0_g1_i2.p1 TRINITY_DN3371_c0_g1~~TRINITY_DN3371_c0_g1_i2.p1  ORF type:complete len:532 (+),score=153.21 TRINITY_DN3371_c0_g1_i2:95-1690(+)